MAQSQLPGIYFQPAVTPAAAGLPPLDVTGFVGFAEKGPFDKPIPLDDLNSYRTIFGGELALARDSSGHVVYANLPSAVAAFFANGGRRCFVVRVNHDAGSPSEGIDARRFLDRYLIPDEELRCQKGGATLLSAALDRHYVQEKRLLGLHSLMFIDEVGLVTIPDAVHGSWSWPEPFAPPPMESPPPALPTNPAYDSDRATFGKCVRSVPEAQSPEEPEDAAAPQLPKQSDETDWDMLLTLHIAVVNLCEARGDAVAILSLPHRFEVDQCAEWKAGLSKRCTRTSSGGAKAESSNFSHAAVFHPWLLVRDEDAGQLPRILPPDGAVCGMIAARERARGVWVAPANTPLHGVLGLDLEFTRKDWDYLWNQQINLICHEAHDFRAMSAQTLGGKGPLRQISARRLMILLRKLLMKRGMDWVFESNHERFREGVRVELEILLDDLFRREAFTGKSPAQAFRVVTDASVNPPQSVEQGRFVADIRIAPAQPAEFIRVQLTRAGDGVLQVTER